MGVDDPADPSVRSPSPTPGPSPQGGGETAATFPALAAEGREIAALGYARCRDYQDAAYADLFAQRVMSLAKADGADSPERAHALTEAARRLALWMTYEDIARVAELKTKPERFAKIRAEAEMSPDQILTVTEYLKPGADEIAAILPAKIGAWFLRRVARKGPPGMVGRGLHVPTTSVHGFLTMRALAQFRRIRRASLRFQQEQATIERWLEAMRAAIAQSPAYAAALAELPRLLKGYGETAARGQRSFDMIFETMVVPAVAAQDFSAVKKLRASIGAALADTEHVALDATLKSAAE